MLKLPNKVRGSGAIEQEDFLVLNIDTMHSRASYSQNYDGLNKIS